MCITQYRAKCCKVPFVSRGPMWKVIRPLSPRESCFCYCCIGVLLPFDTFEVILGVVNYYNHTVPGQSPRLSAHSFASTWSRNRFMTNLHKRKKYMTVEIVSLWWPISTKVCCRMWGSNPRPSACEHSWACIQRSYRTRLERERERERESFLLCDWSPLCKSGGKQGKGKQYIRSYRLLPQCESWPRSFSLSLCL